MTSLPEQAVELLDEQFGVVGRHQLLAFMTRGQVDGLVQRGALEQRGRGQYAVRGAPTSPEQVAMAAQLRARPGACITGPFVLGALELEGFSRRHPFEVLTVPGRHLSNVDFVHRPNPTPEDKPAKLGRLRLVVVTAALIDSARYVEEFGERRLRLGYDQARARRLTSPERLRQRIEAIGVDDPGASWWADFLGQDDAVLESEGERRVAPLLARFDPAPEPQVWVSPRRRVDWLWRPVRLALEYLGRVDHTADRDRLRDETRDEELRRLGIESVPIVASDLDDERAFLRWLESVAVRRAFELRVEAPRLA